MIEKQSGLVDEYPWHAKNTSPVKPGLYRKFWGNHMVYNFLELLSCEAVVDAIYP